MLLRDATVEAGFRQHWAAQKWEADCMLTAFFIIMAGLRVARSILHGGVRSSCSRLRTPALTLPSPKIPVWYFTCLLRAPVQ